MKPIALASVILVAVIAATSGPLPGKFKTVEMAERTTILMGTVIDIKVPVAEKVKRPEAMAAIDRGLDEIRRVEKFFSAFREDSEVFRINRLKKGEPLKISGEAFDLIEKAVAFSASTDGVFDITVKPLIDLWAAAKKTGRIPSDEEIEAARDKVGFRDIILDRKAQTIAFAKDGMAIDMGAIAKGYGTGRAVKAIFDSGIKNAIVCCAGDIYCLGERSSGESWKVGIKHPRDKDKLFMELYLSNASISTSGDYEKYFIAGGRRYSHIIDPRTGYPIGDKIVSATVVSGDPVTSDVFATALCILGSDWIERLGSAADVNAVIVSLDGGKFKADISEGFKERYHAIETADIR